MTIIYRISDVGYNKIKPPYINNESCLTNALRRFSLKDSNWFIIADNVSDQTKVMIKRLIPNDNVVYVSIGHGAGTFNLALNKALELDNEEIVYFVENDYLHRSKAFSVLTEGISLGADFVSLYDHPDKYINGVNPYVEDGGEFTKVFITKSCHWKLTNSTTMTFACKVRTLKKYKPIILKHTSGTHPNDFDMWIDLRNEGASLITPLPGYSTHGETNWLTPLIDWKNEL